MLEYILFFIGIMVLGDIALIPLVYFAVTHALSLPSVLLAGFLAELGSDCVWYWIGYSFNKESVYRFFKLNRLQSKNPEFFSEFAKRADKILFLSKFLYGIRVPVRVLYGIEKLPFKNYLAINIWGSVLWLLLISGLAFTLDVSAEELKLYVRRGEIGFTVFFLFVFLFEVWAKRYLKRFLDFKNKSSGTQSRPRPQKH